MSEKAKLIKALREIRDLCNAIAEPASYNSKFEEVADVALTDIVEIARTALSEIN